MSEGVSGVSNGQSPLTAVRRSAPVAFAKSVPLDHPHFPNPTRAGTDPVRPATSLTVYIIASEAWEAEARGYGKGRYISDTRLRFLANHDAVDRLANRSTLGFSEGWALEKPELRQSVSDRLGIKVLYEK